MLGNIGRKIKSAANIRWWFAISFIIYVIQWFLVTWDAECSCHDYVKPIQVLYEVVYYGKGEALFGIFMITLFEFGIPAIVIGWILQFLAGMIVDRQKEKRRRQLAPAPSPD